MKNKLIELIEVRKLISLTTMILFIVLSILGVLEPTFIQNIILMVLAYYFGKATALDKQE